MNVSFLSKKEEDFQKDRPSVIQVNHGTSLRNPVDPHLNETKKYSSLSKKVQNFQKDQPSITQETRGTSLCNPVDLHVYETKKWALKSTEAAIILKTAPETAISTCHIVDIAEALWRKGHVTFYNENQVYLVSNLIRKKVNVVKPRTDTITVRGNKIVTKGTKRKSLVEVYDYSCDFGISTCPYKLAVLRSRGHDLVTEKSNIQLKTLKNVKVRSKRHVRPGIKSSLTIQDCYNIKPAADSIAAHKLSFTSDSDNQDEGSFTSPINETSRAILKTSGEQNTLGTGIRNKNKEITEVASLKKTSEYQSKSSDGDHNSKVAKQTEDIQFVKTVKKRKHCPTQPMKPRKMARRRKIRFEATPSTIPTSVCHGYGFTRTSPESIT